MLRIFTLMLALISVQAFSQSNKNIAANDVEAAPGTYASIDVTLESDIWNCNGIAGSISWDPLVVEYSSITDFGILVLANPEFDINDFDLGDVDNGYLGFEWYPTFTVGPSLSIGDLLFTVEFLVVGNDGDYTDIEFTNTPIDLYWNEGGLMSGGFTGDDGSITVGGVNETGCYMPDFWTTNTENTNGSVTNQAGMITLIGDNDLTGNGTTGLDCDGTEGNVSYCITIPNDGVVTFHWDYDSDIANAESDAFGYCLNGVATQLATQNPPPFGTPFGDAEVDVLAGDELCFVISSENADLPNAPIVTISEFSGPPCEFATVSAEIVENQIVMCIGDSTAELEVVTEDGTEPFTYVWNVDGVEGSNPTGLPAGEYCVIVIDALQDSAEACYTVTDAPSEINVSSITQPDDGFGTGSALLNVSGGQSPYTITWDTDPVQTGPIAQNLPSGIISYTIEDQRGCIYEGEVEILFVGIEEIIGLERFELYPNPSSGLFNLNVEFDQNKSYSIQVLNSIGQVVYDLGSSSSSTIFEIIDLSELERGLYYLNMHVDNQRVIKKMSLK